LNQTVQDDKGADLTVRIAVLAGGSSAVLPPVSSEIPTAFFGELLLLRSGQRIECELLPPGR
jgi:hypothetical protein